MYYFGRVQVQIKTCLPIINSDRFRAINNDDSDKRSFLWQLFPKSWTDMLDNLLLRMDPNA